MLEWMDDHKGLLWTLGIVSTVMFAAGLLAIPYLVARIPADYFQPESSRTHRFAARHPVLRVLFHVVKNVLGAVLVLAGIAMLVLPGQGLLSILLGISFLDFPRKRELELWIVRRRPIRRTIDWLRRRRGSPPLELPPAKRRRGEAAVSPPEVSSDDPGA